MPEAPARPALPPQPQEDDAPPVLPAQERAGGGAPGLPGYAELHALSHFSFQRGASHPGELVRRAYNLGYEALALTDECSVAGVVQAQVALRHRQHLGHAQVPFPQAYQVVQMQLLGQVAL